MQAILKCGSKQYLVKEGDIINIDLVKGDSGDIIKLNGLLLITKDSDVMVGSPEVNSAYIEAEIIENFKDKKVLVFKKRRRKDSKKRIGHRQPYTKVKINKLVAE
jgi:large subunit ribosomal protein L21